MYNVHVLCEFDANVSDTQENFENIIWYIFSLHIAIGDTVECSWRFKLFADSSIHIGLKKHLFKIS